MVRYLFYTIGDLTYQSSLVVKMSSSSDDMLILMRCMSSQGIASSLRGPYRVTVSYRHRTVAVRQAVSCVTADLIAP